MFGRQLLKAFGGKKKYQHFFESLSNISNSIRYIGYSDEQKRYYNEAIVLRQLFADAKNNNLTIFDVGANIGDYSQSIIDISKTHPKSFKVYAFEPAKKTYGILKEKFSGTDNIVCINKALSDRQGVTKLFSDSEQSDLASIHNLKSAYREFDEKFAQEIVLDTIDNFIAVNGISQVDYLKIDAEGHDFFVLKGAAQALRDKKIKTIQFEFGPPNIDSRIFFRDFWDLLHHDFDIYRLIENGLHPITGYTPQLEVFLVTNYVAILRSA